MGTDDRKALIRAGAAAVKKKFRDVPSELASKALEFTSLWASTGALSLDRLFSGRNPGGIPMGPRFGRVIHIPGEWSTGKSLLLDHMFRSVIVDLKGLAVCTETEGTRDPHFANAIKLPLDMLLIQRPSDFEEGFDMFLEWHKAVRKEDETIPIVWGWDSLDSTEAEKSSQQGLTESGGWHFGGGRAEALGAGLRKMASVVSRYPTTLIMLNQTRDNVGVMFGPKKRTPLGNPPHFYSSLEVWLAPSPRPDKGYVRDAVKEHGLTDAAMKRLGLKYVMDAPRVRGRYIQARVTKTKMALTFDTTAEFYLDFTRGVHPWEGLAERLIFDGVLKTGADGLSDFEMGGKKFPNKSEWLKWLSVELNKGEYDSVGLGTDVEDNVNAPVLET
jgi:recombination protein RecA